MTLKTIIIAADDYGLCEPVNRAIEECAEAGSLTAASVMVNMAGVEEVQAFRRRLPGVSLGLHWNVTQGHPISPPDRVRTLLDNEGCFASPREIKRRWRRGGVNSSDLEAELKAQCVRFVEMAGAPDFWNSHQHVHVWPPFFSIFLRVARQCGIPAMRCNRRIVVPRGYPRWVHGVLHPIYTAKGWAKGVYARKAKRIGFRMPKGLIYAPGYDIHGQIEEVLRSCALRPADTPAELMVHPATAVRADLFGDMGDIRIAEYEVLRDPELKRRLEQAHVRLVGYGDVT